MKTCVICGKEYMPRRCNQVTCGSIECLREYNKRETRKRQKYYYKKMPEQEESQKPRTPKTDSIG